MDFHGLLNQLYCRTMLPFLLLYLLLLVSPETKRWKAVRSLLKHIYPASSLICWLPGTGWLRSLWFLEGTSKSQWSGRAQSMFGPCPAPQPSSDCTNVLAALKAQQKDCSLDCSASCARRDDSSRRQARNYECPLPRVNGGWCLGRLFTQFFFSSLPPAVHSHARALRRLPLHGRSIPQWRAGGSSLANGNP